MPLEAGQKEIDVILDHATQDKYVYAAEWKGVGDLMIWDNTAVM